MVDVLSNPATLLLHCRTKEATFLLGAAWKNLSPEGRERRRIWNVLSKLNTCGIASFRTRKEKCAYHFKNHKHRYIRGLDVSKFFAVPQNCSERLEIQVVNFAYEAKRGIIFIHL